LLITINQLTIKCSSLVIMWAVDVK